MFRVFWALDYISVVDGQSCGDLIAHPGHGVCPMRLIPPFCPMLFSRLAFHSERPHVRYTPSAAAAPATFGCR